LRRKEKEISDKKEIVEIVRKAQTCRIGLCDDDQPYVFPVNCGYKEGFLYFHSAQEGRKIEIIKKNPKVCFQMDVDQEIIPAEKACDWSIRYRSVMGFGNAEFVNSPEEKKEALDTIMLHYSSREYMFTESSLNSVCIVRICIDKMTGKQSGYESSIPNP
jgi:nitroimidazol reductase NimA-like FMN-containing flavoprotein (pyridoxamine 5'-phosphate oxidase superfamily)